MENRNGMIYKYLVVEYFLWFIKMCLILLSRIIIQQSRITQMVKWKLH